MSIDHLSIKKSVENILKFLENTFEQEKNVKNAKSFVEKNFPKSLFNDSLNFNFKNCLKLKIAIIGSRGYPYVYSGYETLVKELSERLVKSGNEVTVYCHKKLFKIKPKKVNGVNLVYTPSVNSKVFSQLFNSFFSFIHVCFSKNDVVFVVNSANGPFGFTD